jgi:hypothetical protein
MEICKGRTGDPELIVEVLIHSMEERIKYLFKDKSITFS